jgi:AsmA family protein
MRAIGMAVGLLAGLLGIAIAAVVLGAAPLVRWAVEQPLSRIAGRKIALDGPLSVQWGLPTRISAEDVHVANAAWGSRPDMFVAQRLEIELSPWTLLDRPVHVSRITVDHAMLLLETSPAGERNWHLALTSAAPGRSDFPDLNHLLVRDGSFVFRNGVTGAETKVALNALEFAAPDPAAPAKFTADGLFQQRPTRLVATVGPLRDLRDQAKPYPIAVEASLADSHLVVQGTVQHPLDFSGLDLRLSLSGRKLDDIGDAFGVPLPPLPDFRGTAQLTGTGDEWALKALTVKLGHSDLEGGIAVNTHGKVPHLRADLTASRFDVGDFVGFLGATPATSSAPSTAAQQDNPGHRIIPATPIAVDRLAGIDADLSFDAARLDPSKGLPLERLSAGLHLKDGVLTLTPLRFAVAGGAVSVDMILDARPRSPRLDLDLDIRQIDLHRLAAGTAVPDLVKETRGIAGGFVRVKSAGKSLRDFLAHMDGDAGLFVEQGQLSRLLQEIGGLNVVQALGLVVNGDRAIPINCLISRFDIKSGIATAAPLLLDTDDSTMVGKGNVNFAAETIYLDIKPYHKHFTPLTLRAPIELRGTFAQPQIGVSKVGLVERLGAAITLGVLVPPAALLPLIDTGLGDNKACASAFAQPPEAPAVGTSQPPRADR